VTLQIHVLAENTHWIVRQEGAPTILGRYETHDQAVEQARLLVRKRGGRLIVHDGKGSRSAEEYRARRGGSAPDLHALVLSCWL
jgi:hypothetical protein